MIIPLDGKTNATHMLLIFSLIAFISMEHSISLYISLLLSYGFYFHVIWNCSCFMSHMKTVKRFCSKRKASFGIFFHRKKIYRPFFMRHTYTHTHTLRLLNNWTNVLWNKNCQSGKKNYSSSYTFFLWKTLTKSNKRCPKAKMLSLSQVKFKLSDEMRCMKQKLVIILHVVFSFIIILLHNAFKQQAAL